MLRHGGPAGCDGARGRAASAGKRFLLSDAGWGGSEARPAGPKFALFDADGLELPLASESLDVVTIAFGFRNFSNYRRGLAELRRVLRPGGTLAILEFSQPPNRVFRAFYNLYSTHVLPRIGALISGSSAAYSYLPESVRKFPDAPEFRDWILEEGFREVEFDYLSFGIAALHIARK